VAGGLGTGAPGQGGGGHYGAIPPGSYCWPMRFSLWPHASQPWAEIVDLARHAERQGWDGVWVADHFMPNNEDNSGPYNECWSVLAGLAASVPRLRIGSLVSGNTYRYPAVLAKMAATVDHISGGRLVLGLGAGWQEAEHRAYGIPFPSVGERLARLEEACQVLRSLLDEDRSDFDGRYYQLRHAPLEPKPVQARLPLLIGGGGEKVTMRIAARYADEWNVWGTPETLGHKVSVLDSHCAEVGRDPGRVRRLAQAVVHMGDDPAQLAAARQEPQPFPTIVGTPEEVREQMAGYAAVGVDEFILPDWNLGPPAEKRRALERFWEEVAEPLH